MDIEERGVRLRLTIVDTPGQQSRRDPLPFPLAERNDITAICRTFNES